MSEMVRSEWAAKPINQLTAQEIAAALEFLGAAEAGDEVLLRALARQLMTAAA